MEAVSLKPRERVRHPLKIRNLRVARTEQLAPTMVRITLLSDELHDFTAPGPADHVKLFFPDNNGNVGVPVMTPEGPRRPEGIEVISRDYTPFAFRPETRELDIDFVLHGDSGPASTWAAKAVEGDELAVAGPRGSHLPPEDVGNAVIVADETAFPAAKRWLDTLGKNVPTTALLVVSDPDVLTYFADADQEPSDTRTFMWFNGEKRYQAATEALRDLTFSADTFVFLAGEATLIAPLRRYLRRDLGLPKEQVDAQGYWKRGVAELDHHAPLDPSDPD